jgi:predicted nucleic acid-binding protein
MGEGKPRAVVLDAGALIAIERGDVRLISLLGQVDELHIPAGALAQAWRDPRRQVRLARTVAADGITVHPLDADAAKAAGVLCATKGTRDVVDASVVQVARAVGGVVVTSDPQDLRHLAPEITLRAI